MSKALDVIDPNIEITQRYIAYIIKKNPKEIKFFKDDSYILNDNLRQLFRCMKIAWDKEQKLSIDIICDYCKANDFVVDRKDVQLICDSFDTFDIMYLRKQIEQNYVKQILNKQAFEGVLTKTTAADDIDIEELKKYHKQLGSNISKLENHGDISFRTTITRFEENYNKRERGEIEKRSMGDPLIDKHLPFAGEPGDMISIAMRTGTGKTTYALNLAIALSNMKIPVIYFSLDMGGYAMVSRILCVKEGITLAQLYMKNKPDSLIRKIDSALHKYKENPYFILYDEPSINLEGIDQFIYKGKDTFQEKGVLDSVGYCVVIFDTTDIIHEFGIADAYGSLAAVNRQHKIIRDHKCFGINLLQINENKLRNSKRVLTPEDIDSLKARKDNIWGSSAYSKRSRAMLIGERLKHLKMELFPDHEDFDHWKEFDSDILTISCVKNNDGGLFSLDYIFDPLYYRTLPIKKERC